MNKPNPIVELREVDESEEDEHTSDAPTVTFGSVTFSDGNTIELNPTDIVVFVGPNNAGKSVALRELREFVRNPAFISTVVKQALVVKVGSEKQLERHVAKNSDVRFDSRGAGYRWGYGFNIRVSYLNGAWSGDLADLRDFFCSAIETETRISGSNEAPSINTRKQQQRIRLHLLYSDEELEKKIGGFFRQAFGKDLIVDHFSGNVIPLVVGSKRDLSGSDDRLSKTYRESLTNSTTSLEGEGDGMRSLRPFSYISSLRLLRPFCCSTNLRRFFTHLRRDCWVGLSQPKNAPIRNYSWRRTVRTYCSDDRRGT